MEFLNTIVSRIAGEVLSSHLQNEFHDSDFESGPEWSQASAQRWAANQEPFSSQAPPLRARICTNFHNSQKTVVSGNAYSPRIAPW